MGYTKSYKAHAVVLRKTKLGEKDLIVTLLGEDGSLIKAVAKGARKPGGSLAAKFELFNSVEAMFAQGRNLDVATDARFTADSIRCSYGLEQSACASAIAELVCLIAQEGLPHRRLYPMTCAAFASLRDAEPNAALAVTVASLLKTLASEGIKPSFDACVSCGRSIDVQKLQCDVPISINDGGIVCDECRRPADSVLIKPFVVMWAQALLYAKFDEIVIMDPDVSTMFELLHFVRQWTRTHTGRDLRSIDFLMTSGLF